MELPVRLQQTAGSKCSMVGLWMVKQYGAALGCLQKHDTAVSHCDSCTCDRLGMCSLDCDSSDS